MADLTRRTFATACAVTGALPVLAPAAVAQPGTPVVALPGGGTAPALGMGSARLGQGRRPAAEERDALETGLSLGMGLIDTAEIYGDGRSEQLIAGVAAGRRERVSLVSKVHPSRATPDGIRAACSASLGRLGTSYFDLYLLHWREGLPNLRPVVAAFEALRREGRIRRWGVSNFGVPDMEELFRVEGGERCAANQVLYSLEKRAIERDLVPWCRQRSVPIMAYSPLGNGSSLLRHPALAGVAARHGATPAAVALAWTMRDGRTIAIPESGSSGHVRENAAAMALRLGASDMAELDAAFPR